MGVEVRAFAFALALGSAAAAEGVSGILAESEFLRARLEAPQDHFLLDGWQGFVSGREFYGAYGEGTTFLWRSHPYLAIPAARGWEAEGGLRLRAALGNEIGDRMFQSLAAGSENVRDNHTPLTRGQFAWSPGAGLRLHARLDQNDHFSYGTLPARNAAIGEAQRDAVAWFGGNVPPKSQADLGIAWRRGSLSASAQYDRGWWWTASPASGRIHPWEGGNLSVTVGGGSGWDARLADSRWESLALGAASAAWNRTDAVLGYSGIAGGDWGWRAEAGWRERRLEPGSAIRGFRDRQVPFALRYRRDADPAGPFRVSASGSAGVEDGLFASEHRAAWEAGTGPRIWRQAAQAYYRHPLEGYRVPEEALPGDSVFLVATAPGRHARGLSWEAGIREVRGAIEAGVSAVGAMEWGTPVFRAIGFDTVAGAILRRGAYAGSPHALRNGSLRIFAGAPALGDAPALWRLDAGIRGFAGRDADAMEFRPSGIWAGAGAGWRFPSDLDLRLRTDWMGEKRVRGWGPEFKVPAHFENSLGLAQSLLDGKLAFSFSLLHAFGAEVREQPNGNPLRFRVLGGLDAAF